MPVAQLKLGMHIVEAGGRVGEVTGWKSVPDIQTMYNLEVTQDHTYTVGDGQWVVHNSGINGKPLEEIWHEGNFDSPEESAKYHFNKHGSKIGAGDMEQYIRKAQGFQNSLGCAKGEFIEGAADWAHRFTKNDKYIDVASDDRILSFGSK